jgi:hypothetical protein
MTSAGGCVHALLKQAPNSNCVAFITAIIFVALLFSAAPLQAQEQTFDLLTGSVADIQKTVAAGAVTYERLVQLYLNRLCRKYVGCKVV